MLKNNEKMPHLSKDPITIKDNDISKEQKELMGYKIKDDTFIVSDIDESNSGITKNLMDKLKQNKEDAKEPEEENKQADKPIEEKKEETTTTVSEYKKDEDKKPEEAPKDVEEKKVEAPKVDEI